MLPGRDSPVRPSVKGLAEEVFASLPWPCVVYPRDGGPAVMVNDAFERAFGPEPRQNLIAWIARHQDEQDDAGELVLTSHDGSSRRFRMTRQTLDLASAAFLAVFLTSIPDDESEDDEPVTNTFAALRPDIRLTRRESQVLDGIMSGKLNKVIAGELNISPKTVELHRANLMAKLRVHNVVELARAVLDATPSPRTTAPREIMGDVSP